MKHDLFKLSCEADNYGIRILISYLLILILLKIFVLPNIGSPNLQ
jgi:hypothetical protein